MQFKFAGNFRSTFALVAAVGVCLSAPTSGRAEDKKPPEKVTYADHILPIFRAKCGTCHGADQAKGGLVLDNYGATMQGGASGAVIEAGSVEDSRLWALITHKEQPQMPPKEAKLPDDTLALIQKWISGGALENATSVPKIAKKQSFALSTAVVTSGKPEGPPPMPANLPTEALVVTPRGNAVTALTASPWAPLVAVAGHKQVVLYNLDDNTVAGILPFPEGTIHVLKFSRNGSLLLVAGGRGGQSGKVAVFDIQSGKRVFEGGNEADSILAADISPDQSLVAIGGPKRIVKVFSTKDGELQYEIKKHTDWITAIEFSPDGVLLATGDRSNGLIVWEAVTGREFYVLNGHTATITGLSWRVDGNILASASEDTTVRLWEMTNGTQVKSWGAHGGGAASVHFLRDGRLVSTGRDRVTKLWDQNGAQVRAFPALADLGLRVTYAETSNAVLAGDWTGAARVWDVNDARDRGVLPTNPAPLAVRLEEATKLAAAAQATADQQAAALAALQKAAADRKAAADAAVKAAADAQAASTATLVAKVEADKVLAAKVQALLAADTAIITAMAAAEKAQLEKAAAEKAADKKDVPAKTAAFQAADQALAAARKVVEATTAEKVAADKLVADAAQKIPAAVAQAAAMKAAAEKTVAANAVTPEQTKAINDAAAAAAQAATLAAAKKAIVAKLTAEKARPPAGAGAVASSAK